MPAAQPSTTDASYAHRLGRLSARGGPLRRWIDPQRPYRWNLRRLRPGYVLDIGCGIGRNLVHLDGHGVGVDHNRECVNVCRAAGLTAHTSEEFLASSDAAKESFDSLLFAHVLEHMDDGDAVDLVATHLPFLRAGGRVIIITPQERGQRSDPTHVRFVDADAMRGLASALDLAIISTQSFPLPRLLGKVFTHNETVTVLTRAIDV